MITETKILSIRDNEAIFLRPINRFSLPVKDGKIITPSVFTEEDGKLSPLVVKMAKASDPDRIYSSYVPVPPYANLNLQNGPWLPLQTHFAAVVEAAANYQKEKLIQAVAAYNGLIEKLESGQIVDKEFYGYPKKLIYTAEGV